MIDRLIELSEKKVTLLKELRESLKYESCKYHIDNDPGRKGWYFLILIESKEIVRDGTPETIRKYLEMRKIPNEIVYKYELIAPNDIPAV